MSNKNESTVTVPVDKNAATADRTEFRAKGSALGVSGFRFVSSERTPNKIGVYYLHVHREDGKEILFMKENDILAILE